MIISHRKKFAFFANPKTGSKAAGIMLRMSGVFDENDLLIKQRFAGTRTADICVPAYNLEGVPDHLTPTGAIEDGYITLEQLREYNCFAFLREPEERYHASRIAMVMNRHGEISNGRPIEKPHYPQHKYFLVGDEQVVTPLNFESYEDGLKTMLIVLDSPFTHMDVPRIARTRSFDNERYTYNPLQHIKDIQLYARMIQNENSNRQTDKTV